MSLFRRKKTTVGHRYFLGFHKILCHGPIDKVLLIRAGDETLWRRPNSVGQDPEEQMIYINKPNVFGGEDGAGGVSGWVNLQFGAATQAADAYLRNRLGVNIPAFRGVVGAVLRQVYIGTSNYPKSWEFLLSRIHRSGQYGGPQWYPEKAAVQGDMAESTPLDMNAAHIIRECLTNSEWGLGVAASELENDSFVAVADQLHAENMGLSIYWDQEKEISDFIQLVLDHIGGALFAHPTTGRYNLRLIRPDYDRDDLPHLTMASDIEKIEDYSESALGDRVSQVTVTYWDRSKLADNSITVSDPALAIEQSSRVSTSFDFRGISNARVAAAVAQRELDAASRPLKTMRLVCNTLQTTGLKIGDPIRVTLPRPGVYDYVVRVTAIDYATIEHNEITIECVSDIFQDNISTVGGGGSEWQPPVVDPSAPAKHLIYEPSYLDLAYFGSASDAELVLPGTGRLLYSFIRNDGVTETGTLWTRDGGAIAPSPDNYRLVEEGLGYAPVFNIIGAVNETTNALQFSGSIDATNLRNGDLMMISGLNSIGEDIVENVAFVSYNVETGVMIILRAVGDSLPQSFQNGAVLIDYADASLEDFNRPSNHQLSGYFLSAGPSGSIDHSEIQIGDVATAVVTGRAPKPFIQGGITVNGQPIWSQDLGEITEVSASWYHRCKQDQQAVAFSYFNPSAANRPDTRNGHYRLRVHDSANNLVYEQLTQGTSVVVPQIGTYVGAGSFELTVDSVADAGGWLASHNAARYRFTVDFSGTPQYDFGSNVNEPSSSNTNNYVDIGSNNIAVDDIIEATFIATGHMVYDAFPFYCDAFNLRFLSDGTIEWDGDSVVLIDGVQITVGAAYPTDGEPHVLRCELDLPVAQDLRFIGSAEFGKFPFQGVLRDFRWLKDLGATVHRHWPLDDGWGAQPVIRELVVSANGTMVNGVQSGWTYYAN